MCAKDVEVYLMSASVEMLGDWAFWQDAHSEKHFAFSVVGCVPITRHRARGQDSGIRMHLALSARPLAGNLNTPVAAPGRPG